VAELEDLDPGACELVVTLRPATGPVASLAIPIEIAASRGVTVFVTRDCRAMTCPEAGGSTDSTACLNGRCMEPACAIGDRSACVARCSGDSECSGLSTCAGGRCIEGVCWVVADDDLCLGGRCDPERGCIAGSDAGTPPDAGARCSDTECPASARCVERVCRPTCGSTACPAGEVCRMGFCAPAPDCANLPAPTLRESGCTTATRKCLEACADEMCARDCYSADPDCPECVDNNANVCAFARGCDELYGCLGECVLAECMGSLESCPGDACTTELSEFRTCVRSVYETGDCMPDVLRCFD
jgi:hypothetical protein